MSSTFTLFSNPGLDTPVAAYPTPTTVPTCWIRPPINKETCEHTGLSHGSFYGKVLGGPFSHSVIHVSMREQTETRGTQLIYLPSLHRLLLALATETSNEVRRSAELKRMKNERFVEAIADPVPTVWVRVPTNGSTCNLTGLGHSPFYDLLRIAGNRFTVSQLRHAGETRATKLVWAPSLLAYLLAEARHQAMDTQKKAA
jgi:hypothetical protein